MKQVDLINYRISKEARVFIGHYSGERVRAEMALDIALERDGIEIKITNDIHAVLMSFWVGFLTDAVQKYSEEELISKITVVGGLQHINGFQKAVKELYESRHLGHEYYHY